MTKPRMLRVLSCFSLVGLFALANCDRKTSSPRNDIPSPRGKSAGTDLAVNRTPEELVIGQIQSIVIEPSGEPPAQDFVVSVSLLRSELQLHLPRTLQFRVHSAARHGLGGATPLEVGGLYEFHLSAEQDGWRVRNPRIAAGWHARASWPCPGGGAEGALRPADLIALRDAVSARLAEQPVPPELEHLFEGFAEAIVLLTKEGPRIGSFSLTCHELSLRLDVVTPPWRGQLATLGATVDLERRGDDWVVGRINTLRTRWKPAGDP